MGQSIGALHGAPVYTSSLCWYSLRLSTNEWPGWVDLGLFFLLGLYFFSNIIEYLSDISWRDDEKVDGVSRNDNDGRQSH